jgi:hypothetical protein
MKGKAQLNPDEGNKQAPTDAASDALDTLQGHIEVASKVGAELASIAKLFRLSWDYSGNGGSNDAEEFLVDLLEERGVQLVNLGGEAVCAIGELSKTISSAEVSR